MARLEAARAALTEATGAVRDQESAALDTTRTLGDLRQDLQRADQRLEDVRSAIQELGYNFNLLSDPINSYLLEGPRE